jgi:hypothetical protein
VDTEEGLFGSCTVLVGTRSGNFLPAFVHRFIDMLAPGLDLDERKAA